jgi:dihydrofolate synthase/folylpolyglutamate synthase
LLAGLRPAEFDHVVCTEPPSPDAYPAAKLAAALPESVHVHVASAWPDAMAHARALAGSDGAILVTGSLYLVGAVHGALTGANPA